VTLTNAGVGPLTYTSATFSNAAYKQVSNTCVSPLAVGTSCTIGATFTPAAIGATNNVTLSIVDGAGTQSVSLTGTGVMGAEFTAATRGTLSYASNQRTLAFGNLTGSSNSTVTVTNSSASSVTFGSPSVTNGTPAAFILGTQIATTQCSGKTVAAGGTCTIVLNFNAPSGNNNRTGTLTLPAITGGVTQTLSLTGS
jgi:hypothetical protein